MGRLKHDTRHPLDKRTPQACAYGDVEEAATRWLRIAKATGRMQDNRRMSRSQRAAETRYCYSIGITPIWIHRRKGGAA